MDPVRVGLTSALILERLDHAHTKKRLWRAEGEAASANLRLAEIEERRFKGHSTAVCHECGGPHRKPVYGEEDN